MFVVGTWKATKRGWLKFLPRTIMVGNCCKTKFWFDRLCGDSALKDWFPSFPELV